MSGSSGSFVIRRGAYYPMLGLLQPSLNGNVSVPFGNRNYRFCPGVSCRTLASPGLE